MKNRAIFLKVGAVLLFSLVLVMSLYQTVDANVQIKAGKLDYQSDWIDLADGVTIFWEDYEIVSDRGEIDRPESITYLYDNVEVTFDRGFINSDELVIYMNDNELVFTDNVFLSYNREQTEDGEGTDTENSQGEETAAAQGEEADDAQGDETEESQGVEKIELTTNKMVYNTEAESFEFEEDLEIIQEGRTIRAGAGSYTEAEDIFYFRSGVEIVEDDGDRITSDTARLDLSQDDLFTAEGNVEIELDL
ncbi:MAG: LPS export ABC transporter periplasmic protein LptC [Halarsenatibacteraceae bacterium]